MHAEIGEQQPHAAPQQAGVSPEGIARRLHDKSEECCRLQVESRQRQLANRLTAEETLVSDDSEQLHKYEVEANSHRKRPRFVPVEHKIKHYARPKASKASSEGE